MKQSVINAIGRHLNIDQTRNIKSSAYTLTVIKSENILNKTQIVYEGLTKVAVPSFCQLINKIDLQACFAYKNITMTVKNEAILFFILLQTIFNFFKDGFNANGILCF